MQRESTTGIGPRVSLLAIALFSTAVNLVKASDDWGTANGLTLVDQIHVASEGDEPARFHAINIEPTRVWSGPLDSQVSLAPLRIWKLRKNGGAGIPAPPMDSILPTVFQTEPSPSAQAMTASPTSRPSCSPASVALRKWMPAQIREAASSSARDWKNCSSRGKR
jgi:hypothetical protein